MMEDEESIGMWNMYAQPWCKGVIIKVSSAELQKLIRETYSVFTLDESYKADEEIHLNKDGYKLKLSAVAYTNLDDTNSYRINHKITWSNQKNLIYRTSYDTKEIGYIKDSAWSYEKEVRMRLDVKTRDLKKSFSKVGIKLTDEFIHNGISIIISPFINDSRINTVKNIMQAKESKFSGKLYLSNKCLSNVKDFTENSLCRDKNCGLFE
jgi:hypothetical protein